MTSFDTAWETVELREVVSIQSGGTPLRNVPNYWEDGTIPWVTTSEVDGSVIVSTAQSITAIGLQNSSAKLFPRETVLIAMYGQGRTRGQVSILGLDAATNQACAALLPAKKVDPWFLFQYLRYSYSSLRALSNSGGQDNLSAKIISRFRMPLPPLPEQHKIAEILRTWDGAIDRLEQFKRLQSVRREAMISKLLFGEGEPHGTTWTQTTPDWTIRPIGDIAKETGSRNTALSAETVLTCSKYLGFVRSDEYFGRTVHSADLSNYKLVHRGEFAFPSNHVEEGSIGLQNVVDSGAVSPIYTVFAFNVELVEPRFAYLVLKSQQYAHMFRVSTSATVDRRGSLRWPEFSKLPFPVPPMHTQERIVQIAQDFDEDLAISANLTSLYRDQKRGLMQKLLTGEIRVTGDNAESPVEAFDE